MRVCFSVGSVKNLLWSVRMKCNTYLITEFSVRLVLLAIFFVLEFCEPVERSIPAEQMWMYKHTHYANGTVSNLYLTVLSVVLPAAFVVVHYLQTRNKNDLVQGLLALTLGLCLNGVVTNVIKLCVGRPRPDFFYRCFPDGNIGNELECTGDREIIIQGRKSFPSGHASFIFAGFTFVSLYLAGKLHCFNVEGRGHSWRLISVVLPLLSAAVVGLSRIQDNRHHWEDVTVGGLIGFVLSLISYLHHYPSPFASDSASTITTSVDTDSSIILPHPASTSRLAQLGDIKAL